MSNDNFDDRITDEAYEMAIRQQEAEEKRKALADALSRFVNGASSNELQAFAREMTVDHRSLVQLKFKLFLQFAKLLSEAKKAGTYDLRNEFAVHSSEKIMDLFDNMAEVPFV